MITSNVSILPLKKKCWLQLPPVFIPFTRKVPTKSLNFTQKL